MQKWENIICYDDMVSTFDKHMRIMFFSELSYIKCSLSKLPLFPVLKHRDKSGTNPLFILMKCSYLCLHEMSIFMQLNFTILE